MWSLEAPVPFSLGKRKMVLPFQNWPPVQGRLAWVAAKVTLNIISHKAAPAGVSWTVPVKTDR